MKIIKVILPRTYCSTIHSIVNYVKNHPEINIEESLIFLSLQCVENMAHDPLFKKENSRWVGNEAEIDGVYYPYTWCILSKPNMNLKSYSRILHLFYDKKNLQLLKKIENIIVVLREDEECPGIRSIYFAAYEVKAPSTCDRKDCYECKANKRCLHQNKAIEKSSKK